MSMELRYGEGAIGEPLHYTWSGLDDVYLLSGYELIQTEDGVDTVIQDIDGLHRVIGECLATHKKVLNGKDIRFLRKQMDLTQSDLGKLMATTDQTIARWEKGEYPIPGPEDTLLRLVFLAHIKSDIDVQALIRELRERDAPIQEKMVFTETPDGWRAAA
jgi:putative transcriptional regulator